MDRIKTIISEKGGRFIGECESVKGKKKNCRI